MNKRLYVFSTILAFILDMFLLTSTDNFLYVLIFIILLGGVDILIFIMLNHYFIDFNEKANFYFVGSILVYIIIMKLKYNFRRLLYHYIHTCVVFYSNEKNFFIRYLDLFLTLFIIFNLNIVALLLFIVSKLLDGVFILCGASCRHTDKECVLDYNLINLFSLNLIRTTLCLFKTILRRT